MPIFEYRCADCGHEFEQLVLKATARVRCPSCDGTHLEKLLSLSRVKSDQTKQRASRDLRARNSKIRRDHDEAEVARIKAHDDDHL